MVKDKKSNLLESGIKGFILGIIPIVIMDVKDMVIGRDYSSGFLSQFFLGIIKFGLAGLIIGMGYEHFSRSYPKISKYAVLTLIISYYVISLVFFIMSIYFYSKGPLVS